VHDPQSPDEFTQSVPDVKLVSDAVGGLKPGVQLGMAAVHPPLLPPVPVVEPAAPPAPVVLLPPLPVRGPLLLLPHPAVMTARMAHAPNARREVQAALVIIFAVLSTREIKRIVWKEGCLSPIMGAIS
jgi:hypothetical protein